MTARLLKRGFTLIELLIVIAIIGVLAVVVLVAINPVEQLAKTRDAGRISSVNQIGHALQAYYTSKNAVYPAVGTWSTDLTASGELSVVPALINYSAYSVTPCGEASVINGYCYDMTVANGAIVYARLESNNQNTPACATAGEVYYTVFSTRDGRGGKQCGPSVSPWLNPWAAGANPYE